MNPENTLIPSKDNIVLIGMPASGKSTCGVLLAKRMGYQFLDTDLLIQSQEGRRLIAIIKEKGLAGFCRIEEQCLLQVNLQRHVIATGGSAVYSARAMAHLKTCGMVVYLFAGPEQLRQRLTDWDTRGIIAAPAQTLEALFKERDPLYRQHAQVVVDTTGLTQAQTADAIIAALKKGD
jgi:shikimate kinase